MKIWQEEVKKGVNQDVGSKTNDDFKNAALSFSSLFLAATGGEILNTCDTNADGGQNANADSHDYDNELEDVDYAAAFAVVTGTMILAEYGRFDTTFWAFCINWDGH